MELSKKNWAHLNDLVFLLEFQKGIQRWLESQKEKKRNKKDLNSPEGFCIAFRIPEGNSKLAQTKKKIKEKKKPKKVGSTTQAKKKRKEREKPKKVGFYFTNLYFWGIVPLRKKK